MLSQAKDIISNVLGQILTIKWKKVAPIQKIGNFEYRPDLVGEIRIGKRKKRLLIEVKQNGEPKVIAQVATYLKLIQAKDPNIYPIFVAPFISANGRKLCQDLGIGFVDLEGNAFIRFDNILISRFGMKNQNIEKRLHKKLFSTRSTWIIRRMLSDPKRSWKTQEIADVANVSLGMVYKATERLEAEGYIMKERGAISLVKAGELLDTWREMYGYQDQNITGYYSPIETRELLFKKLRDLPANTYALTLGAGASLIAPFVRSIDNHLYVNNNLEEVKKALDLTPVEFGGNVYVIKPSDEGVFFDTQKIKKVTVVSNLQLYLDLYNYPQRGREQADFLREKVMKI